MTLRLRGNVWWLRYSVGGKRVELSLRTPDKVCAEERAKCYLFVDEDRVVKESISIITAYLGRNNKQRELVRKASAFKREIRRKYRDNPVTPLALKCERVLRRYKYLVKYGVGGSSPYAANGITLRKV